MGRLSELRQTLVDVYTLREMEVLCADLDVPYDHLKGETSPERALSLLQYCDKHNKIPDLITVCSRQYPKQAWRLPLPKDPNAPDEDDDDVVAQVRMSNIQNSTVSIGGVANVKNNTGNVSVGSKNVLQIGTLNVPRKSVLSLLAVVGLIGAAVIGLLSVTSSRIFTLTPPTPTPAAQRMSGTFNILIAEVPEEDLNGQLNSTTYGKNLSNILFAYVQTELEKVSGVTVWQDSLYPAKMGKTIGMVKGSDANVRQIAAGELAQAFGAHVVIYGVLQRDGTFVPEFYLSTVAISLTQVAEAADIIGGHKLGAPFKVPQLDKADVSLSIEPDVKSRARFIRGLIYDLIGQPDVAYQEFAAIDRTAWREPIGTGKETLDYFLGREALFLTRFPDKAKAVSPQFDTVTNTLAYAEERFKISFSNNNAFALGHWGLGTTYLRQSENAIAQGDIDTTEFKDAVARLEQSKAQYQLALDNVDTNAQPVMAARVRLSLANALRLESAAHIYKEDAAPALARIEESIGIVKAALPLVQNKHPRSVVQVHELLGMNYVNQNGVFVLLQNDPAKGKAALLQAKTEFEACLNVNEIAGNSNINIDRILRNFKEQSCKPKLDGVEAELKALN